MGKRSTRESLAKDIDIANQVAKTMLIDLSRLKMAAAGLAALVSDLAKELQENLEPEPAAPLPIEEPPDTTDGN
jgi:hypothetical protein